MVYTMNDSLFGRELDKSDFYGEYNSEYGFFFFPESEESYDDLERELNDEFGDMIRRIEGVF